MQDANALIMRPRELIEILVHLKETFPAIQTITSYARSKTCAQRSPEELRALKGAGLSWLFVGIESGCDDVLRYMQKGVTSREHISGGQKIIEAGINLAAFVMPGLAGDNKALSGQHISGTINVLNQIKPTEVRIRSLGILEDSPLYARWESGDFKAPTEDQMIDEIRQIIEGLNFDCTLETLQMTNVLFAVKGKLSARKEEMLAAITGYQDLSPMEQLQFRFNRYVYGGYLDCIMRAGRLDHRLSQLIEDAKKGLEKRSPDAISKIEQAIFTIKSKGIP